MTDQNPEQLKHQANALYNNKKFTEALELYQKASQLDPNNPVYLNNIAAVLLEQKEYDKCIETCEKAIEVAKANRSPLEVVARSLSRIGTAYFRQDDLPKAIEYYKKSVIEHRDPGTVDNLNKAERLKIEKEKQAYINPELSLKAKEEGNQFFKSQKYPEAVERYSEAIKRNPSDPILYSNRATAYTSLLALPDALKDCEKAIELDKKFIKAYLKKGHVHFLMKEYQKALKTYENALEVDPENKDVDAAIKKTMAQVQKGQDLESVERNIANDPEIQAILADPMMNQVLKDLQSNPRSLNQYLSDPHIKNNITKLIAAGVIRTQ